MSGFFPRHRGMALLAGLLLLGIAGIGSLRRAAGEPQAKIEYWVVELDLSGESRPSRTVQERLSKLGESGWELSEIREASGPEKVLWLVMAREAR
ncbi:MAG: hypothetical protein ACE5EO_05835 [Candidatus Krumholzibacteriia bacterium]